MSRYRSEKVGELVAALAKAQGCYKPLIANQDGPRGKFANLEATIAATREALSAHAISFNQHEEILDSCMGAVIIKTEINHESDQWMSSWARAMPGETLRETGNNTETIKRRQAQMLLGIAASPNDPAAWDDDGAFAAEKRLMKEAAKPLEDQRKVNRNDLIDNRQYEELMIELEGYPAIADDIMKVHDINTLADLPHSEYYKALARIRKIRKSEEEHAKRPR